MNNIIDPSQLTEEQREIVRTIYSYAVYPETCEDLEILLGSDFFRKEE